MARNLFLNISCFFLSIDPSLDLSDNRPKSGKEEILTKLKVFFSILVFMGIIGCSTFVRIDSVPSGAKAYLNGETIGKTPVQTDLSNFIGSDYVLELKLDGYEKFYRSLSKEVKAVHVFLGLFDLVNFLWCYGPKSYYNFELEPQTNKPSSLLINDTNGVIVLLDGEKLKEGENEVISGTYNITFLKDRNVYNNVSFQIKPNMVYVVN
jgi:hypothetical protein